LDAELPEINQCVEKSQLVLVVDMALSYCNNEIFSHHGVDFKNKYVDRRYVDSFD